MNREGSLHLVGNTGGQSEPEYSVMFSEFRGGGPMKARIFVGEATLRDFLIGPAHASAASVDSALKELREGGDAILHVVFSEDELSSLGLAD